MAETFERGDRVWFLLPNTEGPEEYQPGIVTEYHVKGNVLTVALKDSQTDEAAEYTVEPGNVKRRSLDEPVQDMISMTDLTDVALLWNVHQRYAQGFIYTYIGSILLSVNPYKMYDIYGLPVVKKYEGKVLGELPPHLFAIASGCYTRMVKDSSAQVVVISGESGSGKTECTKLIMGYLALVNKSSSNLITERILEAGPLLESFGNAKTSKNDNSSRFAKYLEVFYANLAGRTVIGGGRVREYLLEKSRIVNQNIGERNYHVFYEMLRGLSEIEKEKYGLLTADKYFYLNQGGVMEIPGKNDHEDFNALLSALQILSFDKMEISTVFSVLSGVLHLGNVYFHRKSMRHGQEGVEIGSDAEIQWIGHLLEINPEGIRKCLTLKRTEAARKEIVTSFLSIDQSLDSRDAIAKILYSSLFSWLVARVNRAVGGGGGNASSGGGEIGQPVSGGNVGSINILDIFGFEDFKENNSFEQLCINYGNEVLHSYMSRWIFKYEQSEYLKEKLDWTPISIEENHGVISLLSKKPVGILHLLDDESNFPKGTDASFLEKLHYNHALSENYLRNRISLNEFGVKHYAGSVWYCTEGFLEKNRDGVKIEFVKLLGASKNKQISRMALSGMVQHQSGGRQGHGHTKGVGDRFVTMKPRAPTVAARFTDSLNSLLDSMGKCSPWFVRCIKPNCEKKAGLFDVGVVSEQLRYSGVLETIRIRKLGYPIRSTFPEFSSRYRCLLSSYSRLSTARDVSRQILTSVASNSSSGYQLGCSKVFLRESLEQNLEKLRYELFEHSAGVIQKTVRGYLDRKRFLRLLHCVVKIQAFVRGWKCRREFGVLRNGIVKLQARVRGGKERQRFRVRLAEVRKRRQKQVVVDKRPKKVSTGGGYTGVNHLEIPAELAYVMSRIDEEDGQPEVGVVKLQQVNHREEVGNSGIVENVKTSRWSEYISENFQTCFGLKREPILSTFLKWSPKEESLSLFKLILRFMNDVNLSGKRELVLQNYIVTRGILYPELREELICQIVNQTKGNEFNVERGWQLLAACLSCFSVGFLPQLGNYLLSSGLQISPWYRQVLEVKICSQKYPMHRATPPGWVEMRTVAHKLGGEVYFDIGGPDSLYRVESWDTISELAGRVGRRRYGEIDGWTLEVEDQEADGSSFVFDCGWTNEELHFKGVTLAGVLFPFVNSKLVQVESGKRTKSLDNLLSSSGGGGVDKYLSKSSKLNDRYYSIENLHKQSGGESVANYFHSEEMEFDVENYSDEDDMAEEEEIVKEELYGKIQNLMMLPQRSGHPRYIKASSSRKGTSVSSYKNYYTKSSAMSDTSEAPSLASHVRRVRVPSQASDVDQFLDDLFSPVLGGDGLDDLSDVRSLVHHIKGGHNRQTGGGGSEQQVGQKQRQNQNTKKSYDHAAFIQNAMDQNMAIQHQLFEQNRALQLLLTGGGGEMQEVRPPTTESTIPPPPPLPLGMLEGHRPLLDPYTGRAKTVRIGKWRWPPLEGATVSMDTNTFNEFRLRLEERRRLDEEDFAGGAQGQVDDGWSSLQNGGGSGGAESKANTVVVGGKKLARPFGGEVIGKLKLSSEMRAKLEQVTSVRQGKPQTLKPSAQSAIKTVNKLDENRRNLLERKLGGFGTQPPVVPLPPPLLLPPNPPPPHPDYDEEDELNQVYNEVANKTSDFLNSVPDDNKKQMMSYPSSVETETELKLQGSRYNNCYGYKIQKIIKLRKDLIFGNESKEIILFLKSQIIKDLQSTTPRINKREREHYAKEVIDPLVAAKSWELYFYRFFAVKAPGEVRYLGISNNGIKLVGVVGNKLIGHELQVLQFYSWTKIAEISVSDDKNSVTLVLVNGQKFICACPHHKAGLILHTVDFFFKQPVGVGGKGLPEGLGEDDEAFDGLEEDYYEEYPVVPVPVGVGKDNKFGGGGRIDHLQQGKQRKFTEMAPTIPTNGSSLCSEEPQEEPRQDDGKHSLLQFALKYYRSSEKFKNGESNENSWTWREQISLVKFSPKMIQVSLLKLQSDDANRMALECYASLIKYMGDAPADAAQLAAAVGQQGMVAEVEAVYTLLRNCHMSSDGLVGTSSSCEDERVTLQDEVYCQIMKQTTNNGTRSCQRGWRLFTILAAYFPCSEVLKPYLFKYLETNSYDKRRAFHGTALVTLQNLRKTFKYGGRRNVPSVEEITAITAGRNAKRQIFRLPGGAQRVVNVKGSSVVEDVIDELCNSLEIGLNSPERSEFSVYCIVEGDTFTMPLQREEYILDVTTELQKNQQVYYLIFCRSVWYFPMRLDSDVYVEVVFNQIAPDYLEGLLLTLPGQAIQQEVVYDIARIAALLHRAADLLTAPSLKETKYLLPKPALAARDMRPNQWVSLVNKYWLEERMDTDLTPIQAKRLVLETLEKWDLFGSSFFSVKRMADPSPPEEYIMAMNKNGVHFLDIVTHETLNWWSYGEIISTRKVKNEDGILYLDLKVGNLMQQRITRLMTEHAHEISRLIRQYIHIQKYKIDKAH